MILLTRRCNGKLAWNDRPFGVCLKYPRRVGAVKMENHIVQLIQTDGVKVTLYPLGIEGGPNGQKGTAGTQAIIPKIAFLQIGQFYPIARFLHLCKGEIERIDQRGLQLHGFQSIIEEVVGFKIPTAHAESNHLVSRAVLGFEVAA